ncbi:flagellar hook-length control protein FliK [Paenibacillus sp. ATY16]|uniref:flagellar hook-length control protein FliK n=1 Tax=Paenibacillus sp. ATY16 TaxID=1759312 RepID=UPI0020106460|nr:flagellar hook-length control protein FliK [Paenibacillus sp. ATY16]MCK9858173.1 flagellar hook-length control protein FliK [Paenibacillus sp. ATY16]
MEMIIPQAATPAPAATANNASTQAKSGGNDKFQKTLATQMKGDKGASDKTGSASSAADKADNAQQAASGKEAQATKDVSANNQAATGGATAAAGTAAVTDSDVLTDATADLMEIIDQLLADLEKIKSDLSDPSADSQDQDTSEPASMLDQLQALLALLGIPMPVQLQTPRGDASNQPPTGDQNSNQQLAAIVSKVQDSLLQLQTAMQEGTMKQIGLQEPVQLIGQQLEALQQFVQKQKDLSVRTETPVVSAEQAPEITVTAAAPAVSVHLQRLTERAVHPVALAATTDQQVTKEETEASGETDEQVPTVTAGQSFADVIRQTAPHAAKLTPVVQASVPVTDFADNMKDFIQKLDIKHGNGMSEATIQLFPKELGQVDVRITMHNGQLTALFHADNANAKDALDNQMAQLRVALQQQGLSVDKLEVTYGQSAAHLSNGQHGQGTGQQAFSNQNKSKGDGLQEDFESDVAEQQAIQDLGYGRAVNVTA